MSSSRYEDQHSRTGRVPVNGSDGDRDRAGDYMMPEADEIIRRVMDIIESSPSMPMSSSVRVNKEELLEMLGTALDRLPEEARQAKWLLKDREAFLADREREGEAIVTRAASHAARLVERREIVKKAEERAEEILDVANRSARRRQREADDYCDQQLARYENALVKLHKQVSRMRDRLAGPTIEESELGEGASGRDAPSPTTGEAQSGPAQTRVGQSRTGQSRTGQTRAVRTRTGAVGAEGPQRGSAPQQPRAQRRPIVFDQDE